MTQTINEVEGKEALIKSMTDKYNELGQEGFFINKMMDQESKTGRNNRCHCGSGKKYKNCCLPLYQEKTRRCVELQADMYGIALEIRGIYKEIKEIKDGNTEHKTKEC